MASVGATVGMRRLRTAVVCHGRNDLSRQPLAADLVVPCGVVGDQPEERRQCHGLAARAGLEELQDSLDAVA